MGEVLEGDRGLRGFVFKVPEQVHSDMVRDVGVEPLVLNILVSVSVSNSPWSVNGQIYGVSGVRVL